MSFKILIDKAGESYQNNFFCLHSFFIWLWRRASRSWLISQEKLYHFNIFTCFIFFFIVKKCHTTISRFVPFLALQYLHNTLNIPVKRPFIPQHISTNQHLIFFYVLEHVSMRVEKWFFVLITWNSAILYLKCLPNVAKILTILTISSL